jgi:hypothetical protein
VPAIIPEVKVPAEVRETLGKEMSMRVRTAASDRDERMDKVWTLCTTNYEGHAEQVNWPWPNASNAVISLTPSHTDAWIARLYNAGTSQDPIYITTAHAAGEVFEGFSWNDYADCWQLFSAWAEKEEIPITELMEKVTTLTVKYGDCFVYLHWEHDVVEEVDLTGPEPTFKEKDRVNKPVAYAIHPKDWYQPISEECLQKSPWCGFNMFTTEDEMRVRAHTGEYDKKSTNKVLKFIGSKTAAEKKKIGPKNASYYGRAEDGSLLPTEQLEYEEELRRNLRMPSTEDNTKVRLVRIFAREDIHNHGVPTELDMVLHPESNTILSLRYNADGRKKRPIIQFSFRYREGTWMNMGVPEMLFNSQRIMNDIIRDELNNAQIRNTKLFVAKAGGVIDQDEPIFPSRIIFTGDIDADFKALDMGSGTGGSNLQNLSIIQSWAERRDGMNDANLGRERTSRTPVGTITAVLEEGNERVVSIMSRLRDSQAELWTQVHQLYVQKGSAEPLDRVVGPTKAELLREAWDKMTPEDIRKKLNLKTEVSTQNLNRAVKRQEYAALLGQMDQHGQRLLTLIQAYRSSQDPVLATMIQMLAKAGQELWKKILYTYEIKDQEAMNPDIAGMLSQMPAPGAPFVNEEAGGAANSGGQVAQAQKQVGGAGGGPGPLNAPGRPQAGFPRTDGYGGS